MRKLSIILIVSTISSNAFAQTTDFVPIKDKDLWDKMTQALHDLNMNLNAHIGIDQILKNVQQEALKREIKEKAEATAKGK